MLGKKWVAVFGDATEQIDGVRLEAKDLTEATERAKTILGFRNAHDDAPYYELVGVMRDDTRAWDLWDMSMSDDAYPVNDTIEKWSKAMISKIQAGEFHNAD